MRKTIGSALALAAFALAALGTPALADYPIGNKYEVKWAGGENIRVVDNNGNVVYEGKGVRSGDRLLVPDGALPDVRTDPNSGTSGGGGGGRDVSPYPTLPGGKTRNEGPQPIIVTVNPDGTMTVGTTVNWGDGYSSVDAQSDIGKALIAAGVPVDPRTGQVKVSESRPVPGAALGSGPAACQQYGQCHGEAQTSYTSWDANLKTGHTITVLLPRSGGGGGGGTFTPPSTPVVVKSVVVNPDPVVEGNRITVTAQVDGPAETVTAVFDWGASVALTNAGNGKWTGTATADGAPGSHSVVVKAQGGGFLSTRKTEFTILPAPPEIVSVAVNPNPVKYGQQLTVTVTTAGRVDRVTFRVQPRRTGLAPEQYTWTLSRSGGTAPGPQTWTVTFKAGGWITHDELQTAFCQGDLSNPRWGSVCGTIQPYIATVTATGPGGTATAQRAVTIQGTVIWAVPVPVR